MLLHFLLPVLYALPFFFLFPDKLLYLQFCIGLVLGYGIFVVDRVLHIFFMQPDTRFSQQIRSHWRQKQYGQMFHVFVTEHHQQQELITRSVIFLVVYVALAIFVMTSTGSVLGTGLILGIGLHFLADFWRYRQNDVEFNRHFAWQIKHKLADREITALVISFSLFFILLSMLVIQS